MAEFREYLQLIVNEFDIVYDRIRSKVGNKVLVVKKSQSKN